MVKFKPCASVSATLDLNELINPVKLSRTIQVCSADQNTGTMLALEDGSYKQIRIIYCATLKNNVLSPPNFTSQTCQLNRFCLSDVSVCCRLLLFV